MKKTVRLAALTVAMGMVGQPALAAGFQLFEQSGSGQGRAFAGMGAASDDASVQWYNPAGLTAIKERQVVAGAHYIAPKADYNDKGSTGIFQLAPGSGDDDGGQNAVVPNLFWKGQWRAHDIGLSVVSPFGLETRYDQDWRGRYLGVKSDMKSIDINPSIARKLGRLSLGAGISAQYLDVTLTQRIPTGAPVPAALYEGTSELTGTSWAWGVNAGARYDVGEQDTLALSYRSTMSHTLIGQAKSYTATGVYAGSRDAKAKITLPATVDLSWSHRYDASLEVLASATWTGWSSFKALKVVDRATGTTLSYKDENWHDTWRFALGANYRLNDRWLLRGGLAYDQTPVRDAYRTVRIPDNDRRWISLGARYQVSSALKVDLAYTHIFADTTPINETLAPGSTLIGEYDNAVDIASVQLVWRY